MSKKRKSRKIQSERHGQGDTVGDRSSSLLVRWSLPLFLAFMAIYLVLYFTSPEPTLRVAGDADVQPLRLDMLSWLWNVRLAELPRVWTAGAWKNVGVLDRAFVLLGAMLILSFALVLGWLLLDLTQAKRGFAKVETLVFSLGVGLNALSLIVLTIGLMGLLQSVAAYLFIATAVVGLAAWRCLRKRSAHHIEHSASNIENLTSSIEHSASGKRDAYPAILAVPFVLLLIAGALFPPREFDVREYHLQAPKEWFQAGRITFLPHNIYANMPLGPQILALPAMAFVPGERSWWWGAMIGKVLLASYTPLAALALYALGRRFFGKADGIVAALIYLSLPWIALVSMEGYVDGAFACNLLLAVFAALLASRTADAAQRNRSWLLAGFLAGAAVSCKYPGALFVVLPLSMWLVGREFLAWRSTQQFAWKTLAIFALAVAIGSGPWLAKNWALTGNPVYPLLYSVFDGATRTPENDAQWRAAHAVPQNDYGERYSPRQIGQAVANVTVRSEWLSPILWPFALLALFAGRPRREVWAIAGLLVFVLAAWFLFTHRIDRFWLPALPLAALLAGVGATWSDNVWWRRAIFALLFWGLVWNAMLIAGALAPPKLLVAYETLQHDSSLAPLAHVYLNETVPAGSSVVLIGDAEPFDLEMPAYYNTCFDACVFEQWMKNKTKAERLDELHRRRVSHVLVNWSELARYRSPGNYGYSDWPQPEVFHDLVRQGVLKNPQRVRSRVSGQVGEIYEVVPPNE